MGQAVSGVTTYPCLRMFPEALEEEGGLPSVSVAGEAQEYREACPTVPIALGWQEAQEMETRQGCVREDSIDTLCTVTRAPWRKWSGS